MTTHWLAVVAIPAAVAWTVIALLRRSRWAALLADHPNERSLHSNPVPRLGGLGILAGALPVAAWFASGSLATVLACAVGLLLVSVADDVRSLPIQVRLPVHFAAAAAAVLAMASPGEHPPGWVWAESVAAVAMVAWMTNLFNFMDGTDGLAGGMAAIGFAALSIGAATGGATPLALVAAAVASASVGFLPHNFPPARVFMGDAGSIPLGFLAAALGLQGVVLGAWALWFPLLVFSPFIVDATVTLARRLVRGERIWVAHRSHAYQRLVLSGWTRKRTALSGYALMAAAAASALAARGQGAMVQCGIIFFWTATYALVLVLIERRAAISRN
jgi:UDP-N-acetylmuramyl pentapeptide phosphotransferase/UDP-N-acetylglucosamine-1-phosphate transferase